MTTIRTAGGEPTGTFRVYEDDTLIGHVLTIAKPGEGPHWTRPLGYQGRTPSGTVAEWADDKAGAVATLVAAYRNEAQPTTETGTYCGEVFDYDSEDGQGQIDCDLPAHAPEVPHRNEVHDYAAAQS